MEYRDYLKRQIEEAGQVLARIMADLTGFKNQGKVNEGIENVQLTLKSELDLDLERLMPMAPGELIDALTRNEKLQEENFDQLADLLDELADGLMWQNQADRAKDLYEKILILYQHLDQTGTAFSFNRHAKIEKVRQKLQEIG